MTTVPTRTAAAHRTRRRPDERTIPDLLVIDPQSAIPQHLLR
jgi:hypothetical protein